MAQESLEMASDSSNMALRGSNNQMEVYNFAFGMHFGNMELEDGSFLYICASCCPLDEADIA